MISFTGDAFGDYLINFLLKYVCVFSVSLLFAKCVRFVLKKWAIRKRVQMQEAVFALFVWGRKNVGV